MIIPVKYPAKISLAENQVVFGLKTNEQIIYAGTRARIELYFGQVNYNMTGKQFSISFSDREIIFTSALSTDGSGTQYRAAATADDNLTWMKKIAEDLQANYYVSLLYDVTYTWNKVTLTAKSVGTDYYISGSNISVPGMTVNPIAGQNEVLNKFFKVYLQIISSGKILGEDYLSVDANGQAYFDIGEYLRPEMKVPFAYPENVNTLMYLRNEARVAYYARYGLVYGDTPEVKKLQNTALLYALPGGVNSMTEARYNQLGTSWYNQQMIFHRFLTWHPERKRTQPGYIEKLWFMVHTQATELRLKVRMNYVYNGVQHQVLITKATMPVNMFDLVEICCGYNRMQLALDLGLQNPDWDLRSYDVFLTNENDALISEIRNYYIDEEITLFDRQFIFSNSYKLFETFTARQIKQSEMQYDRSKISSIRQVRFKTPADSKNYLNTETNKQTVEIGNFISPDEKRYLSELLLSSEVYEVVNDMLYPVVITGSSKTPMTDDQYLNNVTLEYVYAYSDTHYSVERSVVAAGLIPLVLIAQPVNVVQQPTGPFIGHQNEIMAELNFQQQ